METKTFTTAIAEIADIEGEFNHPLLTRIKFILATNEGARLSTSKTGLKQGIKEEDFDDVIKTAINMPIKLRYLRNGVGNHFGSIPVGHISNIEKVDLEDGIKGLVAEGVLYASEYPDEVDYLKTAYAANEAPGISYEIRYDQEKSIIEDGVEWIKDLITQAATIVRSPAYGSRTAILALASNKELSTEEFNEEVLSIIAPKEADNKGGSQMDEKDKEIQRLTALAAEKEDALKTETDKLTNELNSVKTELTTVKGELETVTAENAKLLNTIKMESRAKAYAEAGLEFDEDAEKAQAKKELLTKMEDDVFATYLADLKEAKTKKTATALASASNRGVPRLSATDKVESVDDLKEQLRGISRK